MRKTPKRIKAMEVNTALDDGSEVWNMTYDLI